MLLWKMKPFYCYLYEEVGVEVGMASLHDIYSSCKVSAVIMSIFFPSHHFYLQKYYCKSLIHLLICRFSMKFSYLISFDV